LSYIYLVEWNIHEEPNVDTDEDKDAKKAWVC
jgi:hypothetical protein